MHHPEPFWLFFWFPFALVVASELTDHSSHGNEASTNDVLRVRLHT